MDETPLRELARMSGGKIQGSATVRRVTTDSRDAGPGDLFVALKGERFDGHDFVAQALERGASAAMVSRPLAVGPRLAPMIFVDDTLTGLQAMARAYRGERPVKTVAVAGSNGKTGTKELVAAALGVKYAVLKNRDNLNNHIGVPISLLQLERRHQLGVFEVGTNHAGELIPLLQMVRPMAGVITVIGEEHLEFFRDLEGVAREEGALAEILPAEGLLALNADDPWSPSIARRCRARVVTFGFTRAADYRGLAVEVAADGVRFRAACPSGEHDVALRLLGRHQASNALAALAIADFFGVDLAAVADAFETVSPAKMRMERKVTPNGALLINDAYNANPSSVRAALCAVAEISIPGRRYAVLGEMRELGAAAEDGHRSVGRAAAENHFDFLLLVGEGVDAVAEGAREGGAPPPRIERCAGPAEAAAFLRAHVARGDAVLIKASRGVALERIATEWLGPDAK
ncbi:MAG: UDP-N-acetylmuramoyl-tripeptide--D-alanyl-D-alanine ligase [Verrucomicrobiae bacterium]|nr:UDP-N-acetylmuramoyl-tripeptide--D-alanyl-D-alanine ligase [Verrucomicrobiae bacterium]